jgi:predicted TIM-barrel enzyme
VIVTGGGTGKEIDLGDLEATRLAVPNAAILAGSGVRDQTVGRILGIADGAIVGTYFKQDGIVSNPVDVERVKRLVAASRAEIES